MSDPVGKGKLPPEDLTLPDPCFQDGRGPYHVSALRDVCGTRINPDAIGWYKRRQLLTRPECPAKTAVHPDIELWLGDVGSFDPRSQVVQPPLSEWPFSAVMPRIVVYGEKLAFPLDPMTYVIFYKDLHSNPRTLPSRPWVSRLKERFPEGTQLVLSFLAGRALINGLWAQTEFWQAEFLRQFDAVVIPDFSAFSDDPVPQSLLGERMHQIFAQEGSEAGHNVIPAIAWMDEYSLRRQIELWVSAYPKVNTILIDCDGTNVDPTGWKWRNLFAIEKYCAPHSHIRWLISGITPGWAIRELNDMFPKRNYHIIPSVSVYVNAMQSSPDPGFRHHKFMQRIKQIEAFRAGTEVADRMPKPEVWPQFSDVQKTREK